MQFDEHLCDIQHGFNWHGASRGPSAIAELLEALRFTDKYELTDCGSFFEERDVLTGNIRLLCCGNVDNAISRAVREIR